MDVAWAPRSENMRSSTSSIDIVVSASNEPLFFSNAGDKHCHSQRKRTTKQVRFIAVVFVRDVFFICCSAYCNAMRFNAMHACMYVLVVLVVVY